MRRAFPGLGPLARGGADRSCASTLCPPKAYHPKRPAAARTHFCNIFRFPSLLVTPAIYRNGAAKERTAKPPGFQCAAHR